jgi:hypothetical protein
MKLKSSWKIELGKKIEPDILALLKSATPLNSDFSKYPTLILTQLKFVSPKNLALLKTPVPNFVPLKSELCRWD